MYRETPTKFTILINIVGVLGLCAIVLSSPYDISTYVPEALMLLCEHSCDPNLIQVGIISKFVVVRVKCDFL